VILIEDKASGTQLIQELREAGVSAVTRYKPEGNKIMRLNAQTGAMEGGPCPKGKEQRPQAFTKVRGKRRLLRRNSLESSMARD
jgi:hypothetical protein